MAEAVELKAWVRNRTGKGGASAVRREGRIPGIVYGDKQEPRNIALESKAISKQLQTGHFQSTVFMLDVDGSKIRVIPRGVQLDPVRDFPIHVDFMRLSKDASVTVDVPVHFLNEAASPGLKRGGVLNIVRHDIPVRCPADRIPDYFEVDLSGLEIGDSVHMSALTLPEAVVPTITDRDFTVATIVGRAAEEEVTTEAEAEGEEAAEGEAEGEEAAEGETEGEEAAEGESEGKDAAKEEKE